jgi:hypothetical protein
LTDSKIASSTFSRDGTAAGAFAADGVREFITKRTPMTGVRDLDFVFSSYRFS